jgi:hypothetical protein
LPCKNPSSKHNKTQSWFSLCALESQNTKDKTPKACQENKPPKHEKVETLFTLN